MSLAKLRTSSSGSYCDNETYLFHFITLRLTIVADDSVFMGLLWYHFFLTGNERDYDKAQVLLRKLMLGVCVSQP